MGEDLSQEEKGTKKRRLMDQHSSMEREFDQLLGDGDPGPGKPGFAVSRSHQVGHLHKRLNHSNPPSYLKEKPGTAFHLFSSTLLIHLLNIFKIHLSLFTPFKFYHKIRLPSHSPLTQISLSLKWLFSSLSFISLPSLPHYSLMQSAEWIPSLKKNWNMSFH